MEQGKKVIFSGIQPTGKITIGNYLGSLKNWIGMQEEFDCIFCVVDMHSITVTQVPSELRKNTFDLLALYMACGLSPEKSILFVQSHVPAHAELTWVLNTIAYVGEMNRMTQFKDKSRKHADNINMGLMDYPVLMASDILLYQADLVPVGVDQKQHVELARNLAQRFNARYSPTFVVPDCYIPPVAAKITSLQDPTAKMSKSDPNENAVVTMFDDKDAITRKFKRAVTDSDTEIRFDREKKPGVSNLLSIYCGFTGVTEKAAEEEFAGKGYGELKARVAESVIAALEPIQREQKRLAADKAYLEAVLKTGAEKAERIANRTLEKVYRKVGFIPRAR